MNLINTFDLKLPVESIYVHIPFCKRKCYYCDFFSVTELELIDKYTAALQKEIELFTAQNNTTGQKISTIFIGGGTPSLLNVTQMEAIISTLYKCFDLSTLHEFTIESNPGSISEDNLRAFKQFGINRLSIGIQSFNDEDLRFLRRIHNSREAVQAVDLARRAGFDNLSFDLINCIPGQNLNSLDKNFEFIQQLNPEHVSIYNLIFEEGTPLFRDLESAKIQELDEDLQADMYLRYAELLSCHGFEHYEVSNFARSGAKDFRCFHNLNYWKRGRYFAFGPAANAFIDNKRYWNTKNMLKYFSMLSDETLPIDDIETLNLQNELEEYIMLGLRASGIDLNHLSEYFSIDRKNISAFSEQLSERGLAVLNNNILKLNSRGYLISDSIILELLEICTNKQHNKD